MPAGSEPEPGRRLGHDDGGADPAVDDRLQPALLLLGRADLLQHQHVAVVGCRAVAGDRPEARAAQLLVDHRHADRPQALAAARPRHLRRPQATRPRLLAQPGQEILADVLALAERGRVLLEREQDLRPRRRTRADAAARARPVGEGPSWRPAWSVRNARSLAQGGPAGKAAAGSRGPVATDRPGALAASAAPLCGWRRPLS